MPMETHHNDPRMIYTPQYAERYPNLYVTPWRHKHEANIQNLDAILTGLGRISPRWLDLACGQAWHFARFPKRARMVGVDISFAQLIRAHRQVADAAFVCGDMATINFPAASFDLITNFWAGYCYLGNSLRIASFIQSAVEWVAIGGSIYMEILLGKDLQAFNDSLFSRRTGFVVRPRCEDFSEWEYHDVGGVHAMASPPLDLFIGILSPRFRLIDCQHDGAFMHHLIARDRH